MVVVFVPRETESGETRVSTTPGTAKIFVENGHQVRVEKGAGLAAGFPDQAYEEVGASIVQDPTKGRGEADVVLGIRPPKEDQISSFKGGATLICGLQPMLSLPLVRALAEAKVTTFALDLMPRITRAQGMDVLSSQATVAGYQAVLLAATALPRLFPLLMTAAGTIPPARVLVLGAGVAGLQAIATARRLGARVEANDIRQACKEQVESLGAVFVDTGAPPEAETRTGYAKETTAEYLKKQREILTEHMAHADVVITTALIPGKKAPVLISRDMIKVMGPGTVIVDLAVEMGGNVEGSVLNQRVEVDGVTILGDGNLPAQVPGDASRMFARNIKAFLGELIADGEVTLNMENEVIAGTLVTHAGEVRHEGAAAALSGKAVSPAKASPAEKGSPAEGESPAEASPTAEGSSAEASPTEKGSPAEEGSSAKGAS